MHVKSHSLTRPSAATEPNLRVKIHKECQIDVQTASPAAAACLGRWRLRSVEPPCAFQTRPALTALPQRAALDNLYAGGPVADRA